MIHLGDITKINGYQVPIVDIVTGGSPCQDLSVAGKRAGLAGERSGLFMEQIRIIKEMREHGKACRRANEPIRPRYMVWENVPGAFSSNNGEDFRAVLEETAKVAQRDACIPRFENGRWPSAGCIMGDGWSIAWRVHDAQFWGVPQRRKRIALVADFGGESAPEILFERKGVSRDIEESGTERKSVTTDSKASLGNAISFQERAGKPGRGKGILIQNEHIGALSTLNNQSVCFGISPYNSNSMKSNNPHSGIYEADTSRTLDLNGGSPACNQGGMMVVEPNVMILEPRSQDGVHRLHDDGVCPSLNTMQGGQRQPCVCTGFDAYNQTVTGNKTMSLRSKNADIEHIPTVCIEGNGSRPSHSGDGFCESETMYTLNSTEVHAVSVGNGQTNNISMSDKANSLDTMHDQQAIMSYGLDRASFNQGKNAKFNFSVEDEKIGAQVAKGRGAVASFYPQMKAECSCYLEECSNTLVNGTNHGFQNGIVASVVRRLTPLECERLQGFPDNWTNIGEWIDSKGKLHKDADSPRYKALGNSIALPFWRWMAKRMIAFLPKNSTMASLFDGIGGFPLAYSDAGCYPIWASEIEEFPMAVTRIHFGKEATHDN